MRCDRGFGDEASIASAAAGMDVYFQGDEIFLEDQEVSLHVHHEEVGRQASEVARMLAAWQALLERQRAFRQPLGLVADGRDMGPLFSPMRPSRSS